MAEKDPTKKLLDLDGFAHALRRIEARYQVKEAGKGLSTNDFTNAYKKKVDDLTPEDAEIATDAEVQEVIDKIFGGETSSNA